MMVPLADAELTSFLRDLQTRADPRVSPLREPRLEGLPRAIVVTCEHDPLRDQGEAFAARLREAGVATVLRREPGMVHNFLLCDTVSPACAAAADRVGDDIAAGLGRSSGGHQTGRGVAAGGPID